MVPPLAGDTSVKVRWQRAGGADDTIVLKTQFLAVLSDVCVDLDILMPLPANLHCDWVVFPVSAYWQSATAAVS